MASASKSVIIGILIIFFLGIVSVLNAGNGQIDQAATLIEKKTLRLTQNAVGDICLENDRIQIDLQKKNNFIFKSFVDKNDNVNLLSPRGIFVCYLGQSVREDAFYEDYYEDNFQPRKIDYHYDSQQNKIVLVLESSNPNFILKKTIELYGNEPLCKLNYSLATVKAGPMLPFSFPLMEFPTCFDQLLMKENGKWIVRSVPEKGKDLTFEKDNAFVLLDSSKKKGLGVVFNPNVPFLEGYMSGTGMTFTNDNWCRRLTMAHEYASGDFRALHSNFKSDQKMVAEAYFLLLDQPEPVGVQKKFAVLMDRYKLKAKYSPAFCERKKERENPSTLARKLSESNDLIFWSEVSAKKVYPETHFPSSTTDKIVIESAKNESESFQVVVRPKKNMELTSVEVSRQDKMVVECFMLGYQEKKSAATAQGYDSRIPDKLIRIGSSPVLLNKDMNQPLWFTVHTPASLQAGTYEGMIKLTFTIPGTQEISIHQIPYQVKVWNFALSQKTPFKTLALFWRYYLPQNANSLAHDTRDIAKVDYEYAENLAGYRMSMNPINESSSDRRDTFDKEKIHLDRYFTLAELATQKWGYQAISLPNVYLGNWGWEKGKTVTFMNLNPESSEFEELFSKYLRLVNEELKNRGLIDKTILYIWDEAMPSAFPVIQKASAIIKKVNPNLKIFVVSPPEKDIVDCVDIFCPGDFYAWYNPRTDRLIQKMKKQGKEFWIYLNGEAFGVDQPATVTRLVLWKCWSRGISGYLQWIVDNWVGDFNATGDTCLYYPSDRGPIPSVRLELFRDGIEDYMYFSLLKERSQQIHNDKKDDFLEKAILNITPKFDNAQYSDIEEIYQVRRKIAEAIQELN